MPPEIGGRGAVWAIFTQPVCLVESRPGAKETGPRRRLNRLPDPAAGGVHATIRADAAATAGAGAGGQSQGGKKYEAGDAFHKHISKSNVTHLSLHEVVTQRCGERLRCVTHPQPPWTVLAVGA